MDIEHHHRTMWLISKNLIGRRSLNRLDAKDMKGKPSDEQIETALAQAFAEIDNRGKGPSKHFDSSCHCCFHFQTWAGAACFEKCRVVGDKPISSAFFVFYPAAF